MYDTLSNTIDWHIKLAYEANYGPTGTLSIESILLTPYADQLHVLGLKYDATTNRNKVWYQEIDVSGTDARVV